MFQKILLGRDVLKRHMKFIRKIFKFKQVLILLIVLLLAFFLLTRDLNEPFWGHHEFNGVFYSNIARNYLKYGFLQTGFKEVTNYGTVARSNFSYHTHHPPLFPIFLSLAFKLFGISEVVARTMSIFFSLGFLLVFYLLAKYIYNISKAAIFLLFGIFTPVFLYYARLPVYEPIASFFIIITAFFYLYWHKTKNNKFFILGLVSLLLAQLTEWPSFYLSPCLFLHQFIFYPKKRKLAISWLAIPGMTIIAILLLRPSQGLLSIFTKRMSVGSSQPFTFWEFIRLELARLRSFFTTPLLLLTFFWVAGYIKKFISNFKKIDFKEHFIIFFLIFGLAHIIIFPNIAWYHDYMFYYFFPPVLLATFISMDKLFKSFKAYGFLAFLFVLLIIMFEKKQFLIDLKNLDPHKDCVLWGIKIKENKMKPLIETKNKEVYKICPPFTNYYADLEVKFKLLP
ncbi:ArnT family glycosyltransferase [Patescibacteria group bacterium]